MSVCPCGNPDPNLQALGLEAWCATCLADKVRAARRTQVVCHCSEQPGPHQHGETT